MKRSNERAFTLIETLVVVTIIALLAAILLPSLSRARIQSRRTVCMSRLKQIGVGVLNYLQANRDLFPTARSMPEPFVVAGVDDPPLPVAMHRELPAKSQVYACPGDIDCVYARCGISYIYNTMLAGKRIEDSMLRKRLNMAVRDIPVAWDYDGQSADPATGQPAIPFFHLKRNLLFADSHVGEYHVAPDGPQP